MKRALRDIETDLATSSLRLDEAVAELANSDRAEDLAALLAARGAPVPEADVAVILGALDERCIAVLCRILGIGANSYFAVVRMRRRLRGVSARDPAALLAEYMELGKEDSTKLAEEVRDVMAAANGR